jgi:hypothetical protein
MKHEYILHFQSKNVFRVNLSPNLSLILTNENINPIQNYKEAGLNDFI